MAIKTKSQAIVEEQEVLGQAYGLAYYHACQEFWRVSSAWDQYESLFGSQERVDILKGTSASFWSSIQGILFEHVLLGLCRLTDPPATGRYVNISVSYLNTVDPTIAKTGLTACVNAALKATSFAKNWRDKRIAHNDLAHSTGNAELERATIAKVRKAILAVHDVLRWIRARYFGSEMYLVELSDGETSAVLARLNAALNMEAEEEAAMQRGDFSRIERGRDHWPKESYGLRERYAKQQSRRLPATYKGILPLAT